MLEILLNHLHPVEKAGITYRTTVTRLWQLPAQIWDDEGQLYLNHETGSWVRGDRGGVCHSLMSSIISWPHHDWDERDTSAPLCSIHNNCGGWTLSFESTAVDSYGQNERQRRSTQNMNAPVERTQIGSELIFIMADADGSCPWYESKKSVIFILRLIEYYDRWANGSQQSVSDWWAWRVPWHVLVKYAVKWSNLTAGHFSMWFCPNAGSKPWEPSRKVVETKYTHAYIPTTQTHTEHVLLKSL